MLRRFLPLELGTDVCARGLCSAVGVDPCLPKHWPSFSPSWGKTRARFWNAVGRLLITGAVVGFVLVAMEPRAFADPDCADAAEDCPESAAAQTARGLGLGTGARASSVSTSALAHNTAALPLGNLYHLEGTFDYQPSNDLVGLGAAVVDSATARLAAGLSFRGFLANDDRGYDGIEFLLGLGFPLVEAVSIGIGGRYINIWRELPLEDDEGSYDDGLAKGFNLDGAIRVMPMQNLHLALLAYNVVDMESAYVPVLLGASAAFNIGQSLTLGADALADVSTYEDVQFLLGGGGEYLVGANFPLRLGYEFDTGRDTHALSGGVGYTDQRMGVDVALRQQVAGGDATRLMASLRFYVQ